MANKIIVGLQEAKLWVNCKGYLGTLIGDHSPWSVPLKKISFNDVWGFHWIGHVTRDKW